MKIAIIGTGISGLTCGYHLSREHDITVYEANDYVGGHTATVDVSLDGEDYQVDTGFIVYNDRTYPEFIALMEEIGISGRKTEMSFSVRNDASGLEYNGHSLSTLFAQKRNLVNPGFYYFIWEILRFNRMAKAAAASGDTTHQTLGEFLSHNGFSDEFCQNYILPMGAAIWSSTIADMRAFPLGFFLRFFLNHGLLDVANRPQWYVINGGSGAYIPALTRYFHDRIRLNSPVESVERCPDGVRVKTAADSELFDQVILACHSDQALAMISSPAEQERRILGKLEYQANEVILHTDTSMLPKNRAAWASWNYYLGAQPGNDTIKPTLTYNMNILQHIQGDHTFCVSLNSREQIEESKILREFCYHHPVFTRDTVTSQQQRGSINGVDRLWFCGAYWYNGFHEDGVRSALDVVSGIRALPVASHKGAA